MTGGSISVVTGRVALQADQLPAVSRARTATAYKEAGCRHESRKVFSALGPIVSPSRLTSSPATARLSVAAVQLSVNARAAVAVAPRPLGAEGDWPSTINVRLWSLKFSWVSTSRN